MEGIRDKTSNESIRDKNKQRNQYRIRMLIKILTYTPVINLCKCILKLNELQYIHSF